jgi:integrase
MSRGKRRHHGGTVRQLPSGRWQARVYDDGTGKHVSAGTFPTKADAKVALTQALADQSRGKWVAPERGRVTVESYVRRWIDGHPKLGPRTRERYHGLLKHHIAPHIGEARLGDLTTASVRRWHATLHTQASPDTAAKAYRLLRAVCNTAVEDSVLAVNACQVKGAGVEHHDERPTATVAEVVALAAAVPERFRMLVQLATWTSLRFGELAALTRADVDLLHGTVKVSKNRQRLDDGSSVVVIPKSAAGRRTVSIPPPLVPQLAEHLERYTGAVPDALVFTGSKGAPLDRSRWGAMWRKARATVGRTDLKFHDLRHTGNTLAAATGASTRELMARMGHSSPRAALIYQHATADQDKAIAAALGDLMTPAPVRQIRTANDAHPT